MTDQMYGPVTLGGPCRHCGISQVEHRNLTCAAAKWSREEALKKLLAPSLEAFRKRPGHNPNAPSGGKLTPPANPPSLLTTTEYILPNSDRHDFETWIRTSRPDLWPNPSTDGSYHKDGVYHNNQLHMLWLVWKAARRT